MKNGDRIEISKVENGITLRNIKNGHSYPAHVFVYCSTKSLLADMERVLWIEQEE